MAKIGRVCKEYMIKELTEQLKGNQNIFVTNCTGLNVLDLGKLRTNLKLNKASYVVVKNSLSKIALKDVKVEELIPLIDGTVGLVLGGVDPIVTSKTLITLSKASKKLKVKGGILDGKLIDEADIKALSALPSKDILLSRFLGSIQAPISGFVTALQGTINKLVYAVNAIKEKKEETAKEEKKVDDQLPKEEPKEQKAEVKEEKAEGQEQPPKEEPKEQKAEVKEEKAEGPDQPQQPPKEEPTEQKAEGKEEKIEGQENKTEDKKEGGMK